MPTGTTGRGLVAHGWDIRVALVKRSYNLEVAVSRGEREVKGETIQWMKMRQTSIWTSHLDIIMRCKSTVFWTNARSRIHYIQMDKQISMAQIEHCTIDPYTPYDVPCMVNIRFGFISVLAFLVWGRNFSSFLPRHSRWYCQGQMNQYICSKSFSSKSYSFVKSKVPEKIIKNWMQEDVWNKRLI